MTTEEKSDFFDQADKEHAAEAEGGLATTWKPKPGDMLRGHVVKGERRPSDYSASGQWVLTVRELETEDTVVVYCGRKILADFIDDLAPAVGKGVSIQYHGKVQAKADSNKEYAHYTCKAEESDFAYWHELMKRFAEKQRAAGSVVTDSGVSGSLEDPF